MTWTIACVSICGGLVQCIGLERGPILGYDVSNQQLAMLCSKTTFTLGEEDCTLGSVFVML